MPKSQFVSASLLKRILGYVAVAFITLLVMTRLIPEGGARMGFVAGWMLAFPVLGWLLFRGADSK